MLGETPGIGPGSSGSRKSPDNGAPIKLHLSETRDSYRRTSADAEAQDTWRVL